MHRPEYGQRMQSLTALAVLFALASHSSSAGAARITYDVSGTGYQHTVIDGPGTQTPPAPPALYFPFDGPNGPRVVVWPGAPGYTALFSAGSSLTIETDSNGDSIPGDVSLVSGHLKIDAVVPIFGALGTLVTDIDVELSG